MKRIMQFSVCLVLLLVFSTCNKKKETVNNIDQAVEDDSFSESQIISREFLRSDFYTLNLYNEANYNIDKWGLSFFSDNTYQIRPLVEGDPPYIEGSYQVNDDKVLLKYIGIPYYEYPEYPKNYKFDNILKEDWELEYTTISNSLYFSEGLVGKGIIFAREKSKPKANEIRTVNGHDIIIEQENEEGFRLTSNARVRIGPGKNFQHCFFELFEYDEFEENKPPLITEYLKEGTRVYILGHSKNIDTIDGLTGYWYYCWIPVYPDTGGRIIKPKVENNNGWIFGPLIGLK